MLKEKGWFSTDQQKTFINLLKIQIMQYIIKIDSSRCEN